MAKKQDDEAKKTDYFLKVPKELDEDSWISGEELYTEGSSDEEHTAKRTSGKIKSTAITAQRRFTLPKSFPRRCEGAPGAGDGDSDADEGAAGAVNKSRRSVDSLDLGLAQWRPKRGSLKLPDLFSDDDEDVELSDGDFHLDHFKMFRNVNKYLNNSERQEQMKAIRDNIENLERQFVEAEKQLETHQKEREQLKSEQDSIDAQNEDFQFDDAFTSKIMSEDNNEITESKATPKNAKQDNCFIKRNIELAAKAMDMLPLTDEDKEKLDKILSETDFDLLEENQNDHFTFTEQDIENPENSTENNVNAYRFFDEEEVRMQEINTKLKELNVEAGQDYSKMSPTITDFWTNLVLDHALRTIDTKLEKLREVTTVEGKEDEKFDDNDVVETE